MASETGASKEQIERACADWPEYASIIRHHAHRLVRPDERIVLADDLARVVRRWFDPDDCDPDDPTVEEAYARLRAAIGTPTAPVCPRCGERTVESPRTGRTCVNDDCGWRERE